MADYQARKNIRNFNKGKDKNTGFNKYDPEAEEAASDRFAKRTARIYKTGFGMHPPVKVENPDVQKQLDEEVSGHNAVIARKAKAKKLKKAGY